MLKGLSVNPVKLCAQAVSRAAKSLSCVVKRHDFRYVATRSARQSLSDKESRIGISSSAVGLRAGHGLILRGPYRSLLRNMLDSTANRTVVHAQGGELRDLTASQHRHRILVSLSGHNYSKPSNLVLE